MRTARGSPPLARPPRTPTSAWAFVGDLAGLFGHGTSGEGCDAEDLRLPGVQADLLDELLSTGTPVVVVVVSGGPYALGEVHICFELGNLLISSSEVPTDGEFTVSVQIRNTGERAGEEVVQLYLHDVVASVTRPVQQLTGFARVHLAAGAAREVAFTVDADRTAYTNPALQRIVDPGDIDVMVGTSAAHLPLRGRIRLTGPARVVGHDRCLVTPVSTRSVGCS